MAWVSMGGLAQAAFSWEIQSLVLGRHLARPTVCSGDINICQG